MVTAIVAVVDDVVFTVRCVCYLQEAQFFFHHNSIIFSYISSQTILYYLFFILSALFFMKIARQIEPCCL